MTKKKAPEDRKKRGSKTRYNQSYDQQAYKYALLGLIDEEMAAIFGVQVSTFNNWKKAHPSFKESLDNGKEIADAEVTHSLFQRSTGYEYTEAVPIKVKEVTYENGKRLKEVERVEVTMVQKIVPPDSNSMRYWLNNRRRHRVAIPDEKPDNSWADRHEIDHTTKGDKLPAPQVYLPEDLSDDIIPSQPPEEPMV